jgi:hypothetical protein
MTKTNKFVRLFEEYANEKSILILNFDPVSVSTPGTEDQFARSHKRADSLLIELAKEKGMKAISLQYDKVVIDGDEIYIGSHCLKDFDYVIMGMMAKKTEIVNPILQYLDQHEIPHFNYGTPSDRGNKTQDMYNLTRAGLPYVPTFIASSSTEASNYVAKYWKNEYPVVCKVMNASQGDGVEKCDDSKELAKCFSNNEDPAYDDFRMTQKFIPNDGDFRILIFDGKIIASAKRVAKDPKKDFRKYRLWYSLWRISGIPRLTITQCMGIWYSRPGNPIFLGLKDFWLAYWQKESEVPYYWMTEVFLIGTLYESCPNIKKLIDSLELNNPACLDLEVKLNEKFNQINFDKLQKSTSFFYLRRKNEYQEIDNESGLISMYGFLKKKYLKDIAK